jgi:hypothetical protein
MRLRLVRNLRRGDRVLIDGRDEEIAEVISVDTADTPGLYGIQLNIVGSGTPSFLAVWPGDDFVELAL